MRLYPRLIRQIEARPSGEAEASSRPRHRNAGGLADLERKPARVTWLVARAISLRPA